MTANAVRLLAASRKRQPRRALSRARRSHHHAQVSIKRHFDSELFMMTDWINPEDAVKENAMMRLLELVCGEGACEDIGRRRQVAAEFVQLEDRMLNNSQSSHITHDDHSKVRAHNLPF
jgi:hypothetical protein